MIRAENANAEGVLGREDVGRRADGLGRGHVVQMDGGEDEGAERGDERQHRQAGRVQPDEGEAVLAHLVPWGPPEFDQQQSEDGGDDELSGEKEDFQSEFEPIIKDLNVYGSP